MPHSSQSAMPSVSPWTVYPSTHHNRSLLGSIRKLNRRDSTRSTTSATQESERQSPPTSNSPADLHLTLSALMSQAADTTGSRSLLANPSPATRRPDRPGMNAFTVPSNEPPPAYTPSPTYESTLSSQIAELPSPVNTSQHTLPSMAATASATTTATASTHGSEDPYSFLGTFDTTLLIDDSGSMAGRSWREVSQALSTLAPIITKYDSDGIDVYFLNHKSTDAGDYSDGVASGGYRGIKRAATITEIFQRVRPQAGTPTGIRLHNILKPYLVKLEREMALGKDVKPLNLIVITDGVPSDDVESVLLSAAKKLDKLDAPPFQVGVQFFQVGNEEGAKQALMELDDELSSLVEGGVRDMVDTMTWNSTDGSISLTGDFVLKCLLGAVNRRLDRRGASGEQSRSRR